MSGAGGLYSSVLVKLRANLRTISNEQWHSGKVVLAGDSARSANFTIGMGATLAIGDAIATGSNRGSRGPA